MNFKLILMIILLGMALIFAAQNTEVDILFLSWRVSVSTSLLIFGTLTIGFTLGWFLHSYLLYRKSRETVYIR